MAQKATSIRLLDFKSPQMRAFHFSWFAFFLCFFAWFGLAPLMSTIAEEFGLSKVQKANLVIASVSMTVFARLLVGWACDRFGPRRCYTFLLIFGSLPVMATSLVQNYEQLLICRTLIGAIGAAFVITQFHTSLMFAPNCVGTANATSAGWGNLGGGVTNMVMPVLAFTVLAAFGFNESASWRIAMVLAGSVCMLVGFAYFKFTQDTPDGDYVRPPREPGKKGADFSVLSDYRVWVLFLAYGCCFGVELFVNNIAAGFYQEKFGLSKTSAGLIAGLFGLMNLFARTMGGFFGDRLGRKRGLRGRVWWLAIAIAGEAVALLCFSQMTLLPLAIGSMIVFSLFVQMSEGATYGVVPFINKRNLGLVAGIVGAGGNVGAVLCGFVLRQSDGNYQTVFYALAGTIVFCALAILTIRFRPHEEEAARTEMVNTLVSASKTAAPSEKTQLA